MRMQNICAMMVMAEWGAEHDEVLIILNDENLGFSGGNNAACQYLPEDYDVFFLNNDTRVPANALFWLRMGLYDNEKIGAVGGIQNYFYNNKFEKVKYSVVEQYMEYGARNNIPMKNAYEKTSKLCGFALLVQRNVYDKTIGFDERFNPGDFEDDDISLQIRSQGYELVVCHNCFIYHVGSQSFRLRNDLKEICSKHRDLLVEKWGFDSAVYACLSCSSWISFAFFAIAAFITTISLKAASNLSAPSLYLS
mgnify:FL=1